MTDTPPKKKKLDAVVKGQYATSNKHFFKGRALTKDSNILDVSIYAEKEIKEKDLENMLLAVTFEDIKDAHKPKSKK